MFLLRPTGVRTGKSSTDVYSKDLMSVPLVFKNGQMSLQGYQTTTRGTAVLFAHIVSYITEHMWPSETNN